MTVTKNKFGIMEEKTPLAININNSGVFIPDFELLNVCVEKGIIKSGSYYSLPEELKEKYSGIKVLSNNVEKDVTLNWRFAEIAKSEGFKDILREELKLFYIKNVGAVRDLYISRQEFMDAFGYKLSEVNKYKGYIPEEDGFSPEREE